MRPSKPRRRPLVMLHTVVSTHERQTSAEESPMQTPRTKALPRDMAKKLFGAATEWSKPRSSHLSLHCYSWTPPRSNRKKQRLITRIAPK